LVPRGYWLRYVLIHPLLLLLIIYPFGGFEALTSKLPYVVAVLLVLAVQQPLLALLGCRLAGLPFKPTSSTGEPVFVVGAALLALLGSHRGYEAVDAVVLVLAVFVAFSTASIVGALRCAPRVRQLLSEGGVCREHCCSYVVLEAVERLGRRVERVVVPAAPNWRIFWLSVAFFYLFLISASLLLTMDAARGELLTMLALHASTAALFHCSSRSRLEESGVSAVLHRRVVPHRAALRRRLGLRGSPPRPQRPCRVADPKELRTPRHCSPTSIPPSAERSGNDRRHACRQEAKGEAPTMPIPVRRTDNLSRRRSR